MSHRLAHEIAIAILGRNATRRGMRLTQVSELRQRDHLVTHCRGADIQAVFLNQASRSHRLGVFNIVTNDQSQDEFLPFRQYIHKIFNYLALSC